MSVEHLAKTFLSPAVPIPPAIAETHQQYTERLYAERNAWAAQCQRAEAEVAELLERNKALQCELDTLRAVDEMNRPDLREVVGELRRIHAMMKPIAWDLGARDALADLLRRIDRESQEETR